MTRSNVVKESYNAGELSPNMYGRTDFDDYKQGLEIAENVFALAEGPITRRAGSRYVAAAGNSASGASRLKRFEFSTSDAYMIELYASAMRFFRIQGQIVSNDITASITNGTFDSDISGWTDSSTGTGSIAHNSTNNSMDLTENSGNGIAEQQVTNALATEHVIKFRVRGVAGIGAERADKRAGLELQIGTSTGGSEISSWQMYGVGYHCVAFTATAADFFIQFRNSITGTTFELDDVSIIDDAAVSVDTPYAESELFDVDGPQSADVLYLYHGSHPTYRLSRFGHTSWSMEEVAWRDGPYLDMNTSSTTLTPGATTGTSVTVTASSVTGINDDTGFQSTDVGRLVRIDNPASGIDWGYGVIIAVTNTTTVTVYVLRDFLSTNADTRWRLGAWSATDGYPVAGGFYEQRLWSGGSGASVQRADGSQTADFENMAPDSANSSDEWDDTVEDDDAISHVLAAGDVNAILWISAGQDTMVIGTQGGEWVPSSQGAVLTPTDKTFRRQTAHGSKSGVQPLRIGHATIFLQRAARKLREFVFVDQEGYRAPNLTRVAEHITRGGIKQLAYAEEPDSLIYATRNDGQLVCMTYRRDEDVVAYTRFILGGNFGGNDPVVESCDTIPGKDGAGQVESSEDRDEVWLVVKRTIDGGTVRYVEFLERQQDDDDDDDDQYYSDSLITYDSTATDTITGLDHLEGETVKVLADGAVHPDKTVASGQITLDRTYSTVQAGLGYTHRIKDLKVLAGTRAGTAVTLVKQIFTVGFVLLRTGVVRFGNSFTNQKAIDFREVGDAMDTNVPLFSGERTEDFDSGWVTDDRLYISQDDPVAFTMAACVYSIDVEEIS